MKPLYKLVLDKVALNEYVNTIAPAMEVSPSTISPAFYPILRQNARPVETSIFEDSVVPIRVLVTIRTDYSNEVLVPTHGLFYADCTVPYWVEHSLDDSVMLSAKTLVTRLFDCGDDIPRIIQRTTCYPIGACVVDNTVYVYVNVVIDHTLKSDPAFKLRECHFEEILYLTPNNSLEGEMLKQLTIVKGENDNA